MPVFERRQDAHRAHIEIRSWRAQPTHSKFQTRIPLRFAEGADSARESVGGARMTRSTTRLLSAARAVTEAVPIKDEVAETSIRFLHVSQESQETVRRRPMPLQP